MGLVQGMLLPVGKNIWAWQLIPRLITIEELHLALCGCQGLCVETQLPLCSSLSQTRKLK